MKFYSESIEEHAEVPLADEGRFEAIVSDWQQLAPSGPTGTDTRNACYLLCVADPKSAGHSAAQLAELNGLVEAQGDHVVGAEIHVLAKKDPRTLVRSGIAKRVADSARDSGANMLVVDAELSPSQTRNLEDLTGLPICDREAVILNVFERNATTKRARLQVEIAHLEYLRPRIRGIGLNMDQQMGGANNARGPGETASELLARRLDKRLVELRRGLNQLKRSDTAERKHRSRAARVVLVGYTNAGKTSLMNALTAAGLSTKDRPFETLETTSRCLSRHGGDVLLSDTVGFIRRLPERLLASFESTLAEVSEASLLVVVADLLDAEVETHLQTTFALIDRLGAEKVPRLIVFNKLDKLSEVPSPAELRRLAGEQPYTTVSAVRSDSALRLKQRILELARSNQSEARLFVPYEARELTARVYSTCRVLACEAGEAGSTFLLQGEAHHISALAQASREAELCTNHS